MNRLRSSYVLLLTLAAATLVAYYFPYLLRGNESRPHARQLLALCFLAVASRPWLEPPEFRRLFLMLSVIGCSVWAGLDSVGIFAFVGLVIGISRLKIPVALRVSAVIVLWLAAIVPKLWLVRAQILPHMPLFIYWSGIPFSALYLVVERERGVLEEASWLDDALYLLALPRILSPFFQAYSPSVFWRSQMGREVDVKLALRGAGLAFYGLVLYVLMAKFPYVPPGHALPAGGVGWLASQPGLHNLVFVYAANASAIFCAVGVFRLMGFDLSSGFRQPLLAKNFAEFYRRWNHYVYDSVKSLFLFPLIGRFRTFLPDAVAGVLAAYLSIFLGSYCLGQVLVPLALDPEPLMVLRHAADPKRLLVLGTFWTLIILPQLLPRRVKQRPPTLVGIVLRRLLFLALLLLIARWANRLGVILI